MVTDDFDSDSDVDADDTILWHRDPCYVNQLLQCRKYQSSAILLQEFLMDNRPADYTRSTSP